MLIDASALVAIATKEPEADALEAALGLHDRRLCMSLGLWEASVAIARKRTMSAVEAEEALRHLLAALDIQIAPIGGEEARVAVAARDRYGKGTGHPARLNMGDCFAYACAKTNGARLLYKGDDFARTDLG